MEIRHRIAFNKIDQADTELDSFGIKYDKKPLPGNGYLIHFDISESDPRWEQVKQVVSEKHGFDVSNIFFTNGEVLQADYCRFQVTYENQYPYPQNKWFGIRPTYFDSYCQTCGVCHRQIQDYRVEKEFNMKPAPFVSMYWSSGSIFTAEKVLSDLSDKGMTGFETKDVYISHTYNKSVCKQIIVNHTIKPGLLNEDIKMSVCNKCGTVKYHPIKGSQLEFTRSSLDSTLDMQQSFEWFGDGLNAYHEIIISQRLAALLIKNQYKGIKIEPITLI